MRNLRTTFALIAAACLVLLSPASLHAAIQLAPVVSSGLSSPLFVGNAGDGSNRLFIVERAGIIRVLQPGASTPTVFLDIRTGVLSGSERGLLGLAFHPQYETNGRFFVFYTRPGDGALTIAEYGVSGDPNVASPTGTVLLTIPHSAAANHNGGMIAFGPDGYLYAGTGDGGSGNDPWNNAQNIEQLLGKILRIDVDSPDETAGTLYSSPSDNPYVGVDGRDEIFSIGWRNPWRFSFDRGTGDLWVADVGQGAREEVDALVEKGGNYGWRVYEGTSCTINDPPLCIPENYLLPLFDYTHSGGRCSITGGYVYRGALGALPVGTYVYGDYCTGEIFAWDGATQSVLLDTTLAVSSFGEDEAGELYVVNLNGTVSRIESDAPPCTFGIDPTSRSVAASGGAGTVAVTAGSGCAWTAVANATWLQVTAGDNGAGDGSVGYNVDANPLTSGRTGTFTIAGNTFTVTQSGRGPCSFSLVPTSASYPRGGGAGSVTVNTAVGCGWTAVSKASWITIVGSSNGSGSGSVTYSVAANTGAARKRSGKIVVAGKNFNITQLK